MDFARLAKRVLMTIGIFFVREGCRVVKERYGTGESTMETSSSEDEEVDRVFP